MTVRLVLESPPHGQSETEREYLGGRLVIGRSDDADWQLNDPGMFLSRTHCILSDESGEIMATDASSGGLFIDNSANPVGTGNSVPIENGMRLRLGDFVLRVEMATSARAEPATQPPAQTGGSSFDFGSRDQTPVEHPMRPANLPDPFGVRETSAKRDRETERKLPPQPLDRRDPFELDLRTRSKTSGVDDVTSPEQKDKKASEGYFDTFDAKTEFLQHPIAPPVRETPEKEHNERAQLASGGVEGQQSGAGQIPADDAALRAALFRGMGLDPSQFQFADPEAEMEAIGQRLRDLVNGVVQLLRTRAEEKVKVRVAQTIMANANVNPLKFLNPDDALAALIEPRGKGYLPPEDAVIWAFRDLSDHQVRTWSALQTALRRMIDRFDPESIEKDLEDTGLLEKLIAGGRSAKLWQLYRQRYRDIAQSAEERFLGDVGADFRDAYENERRN